MKEKERKREKEGERRKGKKRVKPEIALAYAVRRKKKRRERRNLVDFSSLRRFLSRSFLSSVLFPYEFLSSDSLLHASFLSVPPLDIADRAEHRSGISDSAKHIHNDTSHNSYVSSRCGRTTYAIRIISWQPQFILVNMIAYIFPIRICLCHA